MTTENNASAKIFFFAKIILFTGLKQRELTKQHLLTTVSKKKWSYYLSDGSGILIPLHNKPAAPTDSISSQFNAVNKRRNDLIYTT